MRAFRDELQLQLAAARWTAAAFLGLTPAPPRWSATCPRAWPSCSPGPVSEGATTSSWSNHGYPTVTWAVQANGGTVRGPPSTRPRRRPTSWRRSPMPSLPETRLVVIDQIASPTALLLPVSEVAAAVAPVPVLVDAAHVPGALPDLDIEALRVAYWVGNLHKWAFAPRSAAVLWADPSAGAILRPLVTSWATVSPTPPPSTSRALSTTRPGSRFPMPSTSGSTSAVGPDRPQH